MLNLHVDQGDLEAMTIPNYIRVWSELTKSESTKIMSSKQIIPNSWQILKQFVFDYIRGLGGI